MTMRAIPRMLIPALTLAFCGPRLAAAAASASGGYGSPISGGIAIVGAPGDGVRGHDPGSLERLQRESGMTLEQREAFEAERHANRQAHRERMAERQTRIEARNERWRAAAIATQYHRFLDRLDFARDVDLARYEGTNVRGLRRERRAREFQEQALEASQGRR